MMTNDLTWGMGCYGIRGHTPPTIKQLLKMKWRERYIVTACEGIWMDSSAQKPSEGTGPGASGISKCIPVDLQVGVVRAIIALCRKEWEKVSGVSGYKGVGLQILVQVEKNGSQLADCQEFFRKNYFSKSPYDWAASQTLIHCLGDPNRAVQLNNRVRSLEGVFYQGRFNSRNNHLLAKAYPNRLKPLVYLIDNDPEAIELLSEVIKKYEMEPVPILLPNLIFRLDDN